MNSTWEARRLLTHLSNIVDVPQQILMILQQGTTAQYLDAVSRLALDPVYTSIVFTVHEDIFAEICSRWISLTYSNHNFMQILSALARILPLAPYLSSYASALLRLHPAKMSQLFGLQRTTCLSGDPHQSVHDDLLTVFRLLVFNNGEFASIVSPAQMHLLLGDSDPPTRYLAIRILCLYLHASDESTSKMVMDYVGHDTIIEGSWEGKLIDYFFLSLWEQIRLHDLRREIGERHIACSASLGAPRALETLKPDDLSPTTARVGKILLPRLEGTAPEASSLVITKTVEHNLYILAKAVRESNSILVTGPLGAGKSSIIGDLARELSRSSSTVTIHLNEQSDIKLLLGVYTSEKSTGSFSWRPGILTQAVLEGRWVIVEDIDRAPAEIAGTLLPLLERGELFIQNRSESILAAPGFKIIATVRSFVNPKGDLVVPGSSSIGNRHWTVVPITSPVDTELVEIITHRHVILRPYVHSIMGVYKNLRGLSLTQGVREASIHNSIRPFGLRELLRWCSRLDSMLKVAGVVFGHEPISETTNDKIFLEAVDCFASHLPFGAFKASCVRIIAQELRIPAERVDYCLEARKPEYLYSSTYFRIGRASLNPRSASSFPKTPLGNRPFAMTNDILRILESVGMALECKEPCLLVGETGTGKTALVQHLAALMRTKLNVINLSQQSEAGDLLGGYKPVSLRTLATAMMKSFEQLFGTTFSTKRNERYISGVARAVEKGRWDRVLASWQEALQMVQSAFSSNNTADKISDQEPHSKRRRMGLPRYQALKTKWDDFESEVRVFQMHLASGSKGFAFSFVEGDIVKAARNGEWVLLDEINLASPDTLESLADLLSEESEGGPSLLLSESGRSERIYADKNFHIFGAMNPATDIGKRDLPASLRSRFTEIFVDSPDQKFESLVMVIKEYLGGHSNVDRRAPADIANLYSEVKRLAEANAIVDGSGQRPHFSLRTLTRTLTYVNDIVHIYGLRRSLFEGFSMSFLTLLSAESGLQVLSLIEKYVIGSQKNGRASMKQTPRPPEDKKQYIQFKQYWIAQGDYPTREQPHYILTPFVERNLLDLVRATSTRRFPILLQGPTSSGKTSMIEYLANISGNRFLRVNNHEHTDIQEYLGTYASDADGTLQYQEGILVRALREGSWIVLDELNLAPTDVLEALNRLLDDNRELHIPETQEIIRPHKNFMLFATQNPPGIYAGRKVLSRAFRNRFLELHFDDIPAKELETILHERCQIAPSFCMQIVAVYRRLSVIRQKGRLFEQKNSFATLRDLFRWALRDAGDREQLAVDGFLLLAERVRDVDERSIVKQVIEEIMNVSIDEQKIFNARNASSSPTSVTSINSRIVWTKSILRLYVLVTEALKHNEPVLLVGDTGTGKTTICQVVAEQMEKMLYTINAHQNMDTSDLIGSQRPVRNKAPLELQLTRDLAHVLKLPPNDDGSPYELSRMLLAYDALKGYETSRIPCETRRSIEANRLRCLALFEWADGSIVQAMKAGQHFLLDEISLADDSVLERLNSVLEPSRTLFLAEKATDSAPVAASHGFQMYATMNPGGDYGKKELSPALRNRFTEIWVPSIQDEQELLDIARVKLGQPYTVFAPAMIAFAIWYCGRYNPITPSISIRDLLSWIAFVNRFGSLDTHFAILEGAAMVYIDRLGADPAAKTWISNESIHHERDSCLSRLSQLFQYDMDTMYRQQLPVSISEETLTVGPFEVSVHQKLPQDSSYSLEAPTTKRNVTKIVRALQATKSILLEGSPGVGKTTLISAIARAIGIPLTRINLSDQTDLTDLFGSDVPLEDAEAGHFGWHQAPFLRAMRNGEWVLLDEMNLASQSVLEGLNACLDHRGQVYISELDQTYSRHDDFVVFAAQNPRHQGGGRKGLPASFVNRFTIVYIEKFQRDDLLMICRQAFQSCAEQLAAKITECITAISAYMQTNPKGDWQGGPWEFNLRDAFRWLQLLMNRDGSVDGGSATDYLNLIFLQRLRTPEDRATVSALLKRFFPSQGQPRSFFLHLSKSYLQVGLGVLPRNSQLCGAYAADSFVKDLDLSVVESIMFCVQNKWPCLLVGSSGSGKTHAIEQLARIVGAELVTIPLNAETDTVDLIGGFELVDPQRRVSNIIRKLKKLTKTITADNIFSKNVRSSYVNVLESQLQQQTPNLLHISATLGQCAQVVPNVDFASLIEELEEATQLAREDRKARFEWVDGILINALRVGAWLVLDNANLCSPSILDRLNSLLEPNGFLDINEHRAADGTTCIVKPHADFRLFLTVDPRYGELSRAMRNRSVELFLFTAREDRPPNLMLEASLARYAMFNHFDWKSFQGLRLLELSRVCCDHLAFSDISLSPRWWEEVGKGLVPIPSSQRSSISSIMRTYNRMLRENTNFFQHIMETYQRLFHAWGTEMDPSRISAQTIHPLNNPLSVRLSAEHEDASDLWLLSSIFEVLWRACCFQDRIQQLKENANAGLSSSMSRLELSFAPKWMAQNKTAIPIGSFLENIDQTLHQALARQDRGLIDGCLLEAMDKVLLFAEDLSEDAGRPSFDDAAFQTYQRIGQSMIEGFIDNSIVQGLATSLSNAFASLNESWRLTTGLSMEIIWELLRPPSVEHASLLELRFGTEQLADRFDALSWTTGASIEKLTALRGSIVQVFGMLDFADADSEKRLQDAQIALDHLERTQNPATRTKTAPFFRLSFEGLLQYSRCMNTVPDTALSQSDPVLSLLAFQPTKYSIEAPTTSNACRVLCLMNECAGVGSSSNVPMVARNTLGVSMLQEVAGISKVPLRSLEMLRSELTILANRTAALTPSLSKNHLHTLGFILMQVHSEIIRVHEYFFENTSLTRYWTFVENYLENPLKPNSEPPPALQVGFGHRGADYFRQVSENYLNPSLAKLHHASKCRASGQEHEELAATAASWIQFFTGCLVLYVPDRVFDPATKPLVERDRHKKRKNELQAKLWALEEFEQAFTGQPTSLRSQIVQSKLEALGEEMPVRPMIRPQQSALGELQAVFNGLLASVVCKSPTQEALQRLALGDQLQKSVLELLRVNIARFTARLRDGYRLYEDVTRPLISLLHGLDVGLALALVTYDRKVFPDESVLSICRLTPFLGLKPAYFEAITIDTLRSIASQEDTRLMYLKLTAIIFHLDDDLKTPFVQTMLEVFHSFYKEWKEQLSDDQKEEAARSAFYHYRDSEEDGSEQLEKEFQEIFPAAAAEAGDVVDDKRSSRTDPKILSQTLAACHRDVFDKEQSSLQPVVGVLQYAADTVGRLPKDFVTCPLPVENFLPALMVQLDRTCEALQDASIAKESYNFYKDANLSEVEKLARLIYLIQNKYLELRGVWPEHATIQEVINISTQLLDMRHTEPIPKFLTKSEQLHHFMHEWQGFASRQFSAAALYAQLTTLLIEWRRLELSTWARLLDNEDIKCSEDVDSWWFIAYEITIAVPLSMVDAGEAVGQHTEHLLSTLTEFILTTSISHYAGRLRLIQCLKSHVHLLAEELPSMKTIDHALSNFLAFYKRFNKQIQETLQEGRQALESNMKEVILLASWKDTNINALRESAKRSHHKLFTIIRKYRVLLAQPARPVLLRGISDLGETPILPATPTPQSPLDTRDRALAIQIYQESLPDWASKPARFRDPTATATRMGSIGEPPSVAVNLAEYVNGYASDLLDNVKLLQKETPANRTKDNDGLLKHLQARKRKLFVDTLKDIRRMGFQSNISSHVLARQSTIPRIFSNSPAFRHTEINSDLDIAESYWHAMLDNLIPIREKPRDQPKDLSNAEVSRGLGYLESMLSMVLEQRVAISFGFGELQHLDNIIESWHSLSDLDSMLFRTNDAGGDLVVKKVFTQIAWLPLLLDAGCVLLEKHSTLGDIDNSFTIQRLREWEEKTRAIVAAYKSLPKLPNSLSSPLHEQTHSQADVAFRELDTDLQNLTEEFPGAGFILRQLRLWTGIDIVGSREDMTGTKSISLIDFDNNVTKIHDSILVAVQRLQAALSGIPCTYEEATWLTRIFKTMSSGLESLQICEVNSMLENLMHQVPCLAGSEGQELKVGSAACAILLPIIQQYRQILKQTLGFYISGHRAFCRLACILAQTFSSILSQGFCDPEASSAAEAGRTDKLEGGVGLGEGEGAEDISKDVQNDEDLSELAQQKGHSEGEKPEVVDEAVDMNSDELEGDLEDASGSEAEEEMQSGLERKDIDEETGNIDDLDPEAIDEKFWDDASERPKEHKDGEQRTGKHQNDEQRAQKGEESNDPVEGQDKELDDEEARGGEEIVHSETQKLDLNAQREQNLDLPEEMDLDEDGRSSISSLQDSDLDDASNSEQEKLDDQQPESATELERSPVHNPEVKDSQENNNDINDDEPTGNDAGSSVDTELESELSIQDRGIIPEYTNDAIVNPEDMSTKDNQGQSQGVDKQDGEEGSGENSTQNEEYGRARTSDQDDSQAAAEEGGRVKANQEEHSSSRNDSMRSETTESQAFKKLGDALEKWHRQQQQIRDAAEARDEILSEARDIATAERDFEHLHVEEADADLQALGAATEEQAQALDQRALDTEIQDRPDDRMPDQGDQDMLDDQDEIMKDEEKSLPLWCSEKDHLPKPSAFIGDSDRHEQQTAGATYADEPNDDIPSSENEISKPPTSTLTVSARSPSEARQIWTQYESRTNPLSLILTEQLRLILAPTQATKMRGDFRTGKRLNIKRIIPYIASNYKRDKIWMRRSVPQKRNYQIMLAVDDSKSMDESGSGQLAFEALVLVAKSLSMLEVGEIAVVGFGEEVTVAHEFDKPFSAEAGVSVVQQLGFRQTQTNVRKLVADAIELFRDARAKQPSSSASELWQLLLIISDGLCEDHETIRRLVRQAQEERIMIVFVIVDAMRGESIIDMREAVFESDPNVEGGQKLEVKRYLDDFPFTYYLVVGDVRELPGILATALRGWFSEVVGQTG